MSTFLQRWHQWWTKPVPPHALALIRIGYGAFLLLYWLIKLPAVPMLFSTSGIVLPLIEHSFFATPSPLIAYLIYSALILGLVLLTIGWQMRIGALMALTAYSYLWVISLHLFGTSFDKLFLTLLLVFACSHADRTYSLKMKLEQGSWCAWELIPITVQRIICVQITATYLGVGWQKLVLPAWVDGEILGQALVGRWATPPAYSVVRLNLPLWFYDIMNYQVKFMEFLIPIGLWVPKLRWVFFVWGAVFHILIAILMAIWWFVVLIPCYLLFLDPFVVKEWCEKLYCKN